MDRLTALNVFVTIVDQGSFSAAADHLDISRAKVTRYLSELESWMDTRLLHRTTRNLSLTAIGEETYYAAQNVLDMAQSLEQIKQKNSFDLQGALRLTASFTLVDTVLLDVVDEFVRLWPKTTIDILSTDEQVNLIEQRIDLALRITNDLAPNVVARHLGDCRSVVCASPEYLKQFGTPKTVQDLTHHNCLSYSFFGRKQWHFEGPNGSESVSIHGNISSNVSEVLLGATLKGSGISLQPWPTVSRLISNGTLTPLLNDWKADTLGVYAVYATRKQITPLQRAFIDFLSAKIESQPDWQKNGS